MAKLSIGHRQRPDPAVDETFADTEPPFEAGPTGQGNGLSEIKELLSVDCCTAADFA